MALILSSPPVEGIVCQLRIEFLQFVKTMGGPGPQFVHTTAWLTSYMFGGSKSRPNVDTPPVQLRVYQRIGFAEPMKRHLN